MFPNINQVLYVQVNSIVEEEAREEHRSRIADASDKYIMIELPISEKHGQVKRLYAGDELSIYFMTEGGVKNYFSSIVLGFKEDVIPMAVIRRPQPEAISKIQRRSFLRVPAELEIAICTKNSLRSVALTNDVSGGGLSMLCDTKTPLRNSDILSCWLLLSYKSGKIDHIYFRGEIVRIKVLEGDRKHVMMRFLQITDKDRQQIIRYCYERQLDIRKT